MKQLGFPLPCSSMDSFLLPEVEREDWLEEVLNSWSPSSPSEEGPGKPISKVEIIKRIALKSNFEVGMVRDVINSLVDLAGEELEKRKVFTLPGFVRVKARARPALQAGGRTIFGKRVQVKAKPATVVIRAQPVNALKRRFFHGPPGPPIPRKPRPRRGRRAEIPEVPVGEDEPDAAAIFCVRGFLHLQLNVMIGQNYTFGELRQRCRGNPRKIRRLVQFSSDASVLVPVQATETV